MKKFWICSMICLLAVSPIAFVGCKDSAGTAAAPSGSELEQFLVDNPDVAAEEDLADEEEDE